jgi:acetoin utilization protein AcuB
MVEITAEDRMTKEPRSVPPDLNVWAALATMREEGIRHLLVTEHEALVGVVSNRDYRKILERAHPDGTVRNVFQITVSSIMTPADRVVTVRPETSLLDVAHLIVTRKIGCVPVVDDQNRPVGILTQKDVMAALLELLRPRPSS